MQTLSEDERDILSMVAGGGLSYDEIASVMAMSVANIKVKVHRARLRLKQYLEGGNHE
jgi:RNA polymerase sigma-70 factor (ECF subfamily)